MCLALLFYERVFLKLRRHKPQLPLCRCELFRALPARLAGPVGGPNHLFLLFLSLPVKVKHDGNTAEEHCRHAEFEDLEIELVAQVACLVPAMNEQEF